jgi:hypothetical protein
MHMMHFMKVFSVVPLIPALFVFGMGMVLLHYGKKESSCTLKWGGWVMSVGTALIMLFLLVMIAKHHFGCGEHKGMMGEGPQGCQCAMAQGMEGAQGCGCQGMHSGPNPEQPQQPAPATHKYHH